MSELEDVINNKWCYLEIRKKLSELSEVPTMAIVTDEHIKRIANRIHLLEEQIKTVISINEKFFNAYEIARKQREDA